MLSTFSVDLAALRGTPFLRAEPAPGTLCYELCLRQAGAVFARQMFRDEPRLELALYTRDAAVPAARLARSLLGGVYRLPRAAGRVSLHLREVARRGDRVCLRTHVTEATSACQDEPVLEWEAGAAPPAGRFLRDVRHAPAAPARRSALYKIQDPGRFRAGRFWDPQSAFYSGCAVTASDEVHRENLEILLRCCAAPPADVLALLKRAGAALVGGGRVVYRNDETFGGSGAPTDAGDDHVETSGAGDCEDFAHLYMRAFRTLAQFGPYVPALRDAPALRTLRERYTPFVHICRVELGGALIFHSTMVVLPDRRDDAAAPAIGFEVTNPARSYYLPNPDYDSFHRDNYYLLDALFIAPAPADLAAADLAGLAPGNL